MKRMLLIAGVVAGMAAHGNSLAQPAVDPDPTAGVAAAGLDVAEIESFRGARQRFRSRMEELQNDTRSYVALREREQRDRLVGGFDAMIAELSAAEQGQRELTIQRFEDFVERYPSAPYASHVRFRLADLYFEQDSEKWQQAAEAYFAKLDEPDLSYDALEAIGPQPLRDLSRSLDLYRRIIADNVGLPAADRYERLDGTYVMLGFVHNDPNNVQFDEALARRAFEDLIDEVPESDLADRAYLFLGNFAFADNRFDDAIAAYEAVYSKGDRSKYYMEGLYQLAWARYKLNAFDESLELFTELLDASHQQELNSGRESAFAPDAKRFMAFSFADLGYDLDRNAHEIAGEYFLDAGERPYEREVYVDLADVLERYTRPEEAIEVYRLLQSDPRWVDEPDNPQHQITLLGLYQTSVARDLERAGAERLAFIDRYSEGTPWWDANRNDPEALEVARTYIESSLLDVAIEFRVRAQESQNPADYAVAARKYEEYLDRFPISDDFYDQQWFLADSLKMAGDHQGAVAEFDSLVRSSRFHPYGDGARYATMEVRYQQMTDLGHVPHEPPVDAPVERMLGEGDNAIAVYALSQDRIDFVNAADMVVRHEFTTPDNPDLPDYRAEVEQRRPSMMYIASQILFYHNHLAEARLRFEDLIARYPRALESNYAAGLLVDSFLLEGDLEQVRSYTLRFTINPPGPTSDIDPEQFKGTLEGTTFKLAMEQASQGDNQGAAEAFIAFREEFPASPFDTDALYNAAFYYQQAGKVEQSNAMYEQFVEEHPDDKRAKGLLFRIAANYESAFELDRAEQFYDQVLRHPDATDAEKADAQFNRSFLLIGLGRHRDAAKGFEAYDKDFPQQEDRESILWLAGEQWEKAGTDPAIDFYERYLRKYPSQEPDHVIEAQYRLLSLYRDKGLADRAVRKQNQQILDAFDRLIGEGAEIGANGHLYAAAADFPRLEARFADYSDEALTGNETKDAALLNQVKPQELKAFEEEVRQYIGRFQSFEYNSGALYLQAKAALYMADLGLSISCPTGISEEDCWLYEDILQEKVFPQYYEIEEVGIRRLQELLAAATERKRHSPFIDLAQEELNRRRPADFPAVKIEVEGGIDATMPVPLVPRRLSATQEEQP